MCELDMDATDSPACTYIIWNMFGLGRWRVGDVVHDRLAEEPVARV